MGKVFGITLGILAGMFLILQVVPDPYDDWLLVTLMVGFAVLAARHAWRARQLANETPLVATLHRTATQRASLGFAFLFTIMFMVSMRQDPQSVDFTSSILPWIILTLIGTQLISGLPPGRITEAGILIHDMMFRWESVKNAGWISGEKATLAFDYEHQGKLVNTKWKLHPADIEPMNAALARYAGQQASARR